MPGITCHAETSCIIRVEGLPFVNNHCNKFQMKFFPYQVCFVPTGEGEQKFQITRCHLLRHLGVYILRSSAVFSNVRKCITLTSFLVLMVCTSILLDMLKEARRDRCSFGSIQSIRTEQLLPSCIGLHSNLYYFSIVSRVNLGVSSDGMSILQSEKNLQLICCFQPTG